MCSCLVLFHVLFDCTQHHWVFSSCKGTVGPGRIRNDSYILDLFYLGYIYRFYSQTDIITKTWYGLLKDIIDKEFQKVIVVKVGSPGFV